ncbi:DUF3887 domain-containing protein [Pedobacter sp. SD-b]|uniref:DUF3887 domain-containing protein n=1 Tax=Pedobacter segetis TaxID=2793069 RepID=A0ABS1BGJ7_9SPHI|nr:DUF3887 domain-containing protein [Pedobacter segetis]MBK0381990.1 DUF3887 domain-containing protein [Pedobacter segetis]
MKEIKILIFFLLMSFSAFSQGIFEHINIANDFFDKLDKGKYTEAQNLFDDSVKTKLKPETLEKIWGQLQANLGKLVSIDGAQNKTQGQYQIVVLNCKFTNATQPFQFVFNKTNKLVGFFAAPKTPIEEYKLPAYADTSRYVEKLINIKSGEHDLPAMLTLPRDSMNCPIVVLVHGSGPSDMDETIGAHKPFKDIALGLASKGIASIRYVKRTMLFPQDFRGAFTTKEEVEDDALNVIAYAKTIPQVDSTKLYLFGHSLGGMLAPRIASKTNLKGLILAAAPARKLQDISLEQNNYFYALSKDTTKLGKEALTEAAKQLNFTKTLTAKTLPADSLILGLPASYWVDLNGYNQIATAKKLDDRILIIQGGNDFQVSDKDFNLWVAGLKGKKQVDSKIYPLLNHLFSFESEKGTLAQYQKPGNVDQTVIDDMASWILEK